MEIFLGSKILLTQIMTSKQEKKDPLNSLDIMHLHLPLNAFFKKISDIFPNLHHPVFPEHFAHLTFAF